MANNLDLSLDDLIKKNKTSTSSNSFNSKRGGRGRAGILPRGGAAAAARNFPDRSARRPAPYPAAPNNKYGVYTDQQIAAAAAAAAAAAVGRVLSIETGTKLYISNLDYGVSNEDIKELFAEVGEIKRYSINYDRSGRSKGTAEVVYAKKDDALAALRRYNNVQLDGKPMKIEFIGTNTETTTLGPAPPLPSLLPSPLNPPPLGVNWGGPGILNGVPKSGPGRGGMFNGGPGRGVMFNNNGPRMGNSFAPRGRGGRAGRVNGVANGRGHGKQVSAADLDAELEKYHAGAMETE